MKTLTVLPIFATLALVVTLVPAAAGAARAASAASPSLVLGPKATPVATATASYGLFHVSGGPRSPPASSATTPTKSGTPINIDTLINSGFTGRR